MIVRIAAAALSFVAVAALAQGYPAKPVTLIVPFAAGGPADVLSRNVAVALGKQLKQSIVVENVGGASGNIGAARAAKAPPDGYTLFYHNLGMATATLLYRNLDFNPIADFDAIGLIASSPNVLLSRADFPAASFKELLGYIRANQEKITMADAGPGGPSSLCGLLFMSATGTRLTAVPYKGTAPAMNDLLGRQVDLLCDASATAAPQIRSGKVKAFGLTGRSRLASLPGIPTLEEQGLTGFEMVVWQALFAPRGLAKPVLDRLVAALQASLGDAELNAFFDKTGFQPVARDQATPAGLSAFLKAEIDKWGPVIARSGIKPQ